MQFGDGVRLGRCRKRFEDWRDDERDSLELDLQMYKSMWENVVVDMSVNDRCWISSFSLYKFPSLLWHSIALMVNHIVL